MTTIAHISDIHLSPLPAVKPSDLVGKRLTGYLNWKMVRRDSLGGEGMVNLVRHLREQSVDFIAVTGDLTNLALKDEVTRAHGWLQSLGPAEKVCVSPGNHDAYVGGALEQAMHIWGDYIAGETVTASPFPFVRLVGDVAIVSCSSAVPTAPFMATGWFSPQQGERLALTLQRLEEAGYFRVVMIHHPPNTESQHPMFGLKGYKTFQDVVHKHGAELVLHGHTHRSSIHTIKGPKGEVPVIGVAAAGAAQGGIGEDPARYNYFKIDRSGSGWSCTMREYGFQRIGTEIVMRLQMRIY